MNVKTIVNGFFFGNCHLVWDEAGNCIVIDPGDEEELIYHSIRELGLKPTVIVGTHANLDSVGAAQDLREMLGVPFALSGLEIGMFEFLPRFARYLGLPAIKIPTVDIEVVDGDEIEAGGVRLKVIHTPGHTPGSICLAGEGCVFTGDTLLAGSYGRTDLKGGSEMSILSSIHTRLFLLDDSTVVYPGHGPKTTIGDEKRSNWAVVRKAILDEQTGEEP